MTEVLCGYRYPRTAPCDLVVIHTNEGPEGPTTAEGLAYYLKGLTAKTSPGYHRTVDENSSVITARDAECVNGAGGVNSRSFHICITGYAAQTRAQWQDPSSSAALRIAAQETRDACARLRVPVARIADPRTFRGICGHADVSRYYTASQGHSDPGAGFPWDEFMALVVGTPAAGPILDMSLLAQQQRKKQMAGPLTTVYYLGNLHIFQVGSDGHLLHWFGPTAKEDLNAIYKVAEGMDPNGALIADVTPGDVLTVTGRVNPDRLLRWHYNPSGGWGVEALTR